MPIIAKKPKDGTTFKPAPEGVTPAVCCDVVDLGMVSMTYPGQPPKTKHLIRIAWQLPDVDPETGQRPTVVKRYTNSLHEKATLRKDLESWRGKKFTDAETEGFDVERVIGVPALLNIQHNTVKENTYANVIAVMPLVRGMVCPPVAKDYVRHKDRPDAEQAATNGRQPGEEEEDGEGIPF